MYHQLFLLRIKGINVLILVWSFSKCKINLIFHPPTFSGAFTRDILASSVDLWRQILLKLQDLCFVERSNSAFKHWIVSLSFFTAVLSGWISAPIFSPSAWRQTLGRSRDSAVCSPRLLKDMMDASLKDPFCHPDAQLESGRLQPTTPDRKVGGQHQSPSGPHWLCLPVQSTGPPWEKQLRKVSWWCSTC